MGEQPRNAPLPPHRKWWVERMSFADRRSYLLADELESLAVSRKGEASSAIRGFLVAWRKATQGGNPIGLELKVKRARANTAIVFAHSPHIGSVRWLPVLVVPWNHRFDRIRRECGDDLMFAWTAEPKRDVWGESEPRSRPRVDKVVIRLVEPKR